MGKKHFKIGDIVTVEVIGLQDYGVFVKFIDEEKETGKNKKSKDNEDELRGLIHISEIQSGYVKNIHDLIKVGEKLRAQIIDIDEYNGKISLSTRTLEANPQSHHAYYKRHFTNRNDKIGFKSLENELTGWISENEAYLAAKEEAK